ncbi:MAG: TIGR00282 family metallophosphoesterase [Thermosediminibacteraceae bacterium]|nr:TIGR00282 family metallophosphoesterase [Thermosediminibacteraceae bacterium]
MNIMFIGDIVGRPGRRIIRETLPDLKKSYSIDFVIANAENAAGGNGITKKIAEELFSYGVDFLTMGNHVWDNKEIFDFIEEELRMVRPANYPPGAPGRGSQVVDLNRDLKIGILNISGRVFMPDLDCPFRTADRELEKLKKVTNIIIVDFHAEATSEKLAMGWYLDGRASLVVGTHTHVQTADERILPGGTAYITDVGMTGAYDGILGIEREPVIKKFLTQMPVRFEVAKGVAQLNAIVVEVDIASGLAQKIQRINIK